MSDEDFDTKREQFNNLWDSSHRTKKLKFRQYIREHVRQKRVALTRENCEKYWMGELQKEMRDAETF